MKRTVVVVVAIVIVACIESPEVTRSGIDINDSAGIGIVTSPPGDEVHAELAGEPALSIGLLDGEGELLFGSIASVRRSAAGNLVVADAQAREIRIFDAAGRHLRSLGGKGEAPGEFQSLDGAWPVSYADDSGAGQRMLVAVDSRLDRITRFGGDGGMIGTATFAGRDELLIRAIGLGGEDAILSRATVFDVPALQSLSGSPEDVMKAMVAGESNRRLLYLRHRFDGTLVDTVVEGRAAARYVLSDGSGKVLAATVPFSPQAAAAGSAHGVVFTAGAHYELRVFDDAGSLRLIARLDEAPPVRTDEHLETWVRNPGGRERDEAWVRERLKQYRSLALPESLPAYTAVLFADVGNIWARRYRMPGESMAHWDVFGTDGDHLGRVEIPTSFRIQEVSRGQVVGIATDELGVERVEVRDLYPVGG